MASDDKVTELVGEKIIELAVAGEHDADRLAARVLASKLPRPPPRCRSEYVVSSSVVVYFFIVYWLIGLLVL